MKVLFVILSICFIFVNANLVIPKNIGHVTVKILTETTDDPLFVASQLTQEKDIESVPETVYQVIKNK
jgi:hypothetical protein